MIGLQLTQLSSANAVTYVLTITPPGGSLILYSSSPIKAMLEQFYIKMSQYLFDKRLPYSFQAVKRGKSYCNRPDTHTKAFLDLAVEILNKIYGQILNQEEDKQGSNRLPRQLLMISCTCQSVNQEILSLVLQKYG
jgi:hypothetical protein